MERDGLERLLFGKWADSFDIDQVRWLTAAISSSRYADVHMRGCPRFANKYDLLNHCLDAISLDGLLLEFGVYSGDTIRRIAHAKPTKTIYGFDSFEGLPENWRDEFSEGSFAVGALPEVPDNVELIKGWFNNTLPTFARSQPCKIASFIHVDCDLYSSTQTIFAELKRLICQNTIIVFDEFFNYPGWELHEAKALTEFCLSTGVFFEFIGVVPNHQQAAIRVLNNPI